MRFFGLDVQPALTNFEDHFTFPIARRPSVATTSGDFAGGFLLGSLVGPAWEGFDDG